MPNMASCHPDRLHNAKGLCKSCYDMQRAEARLIGIEPRLCECGCGAYAKPGKRFIRFHATSTPEWRAVMSSRFKGKPRSDEDRRKISGSHHGIGHGVEAREKIRQHRLGKPLSKETKEKLSLALTGDRNPAWRGGKKLIPYDPMWTQIRKRILKRDGRRCMRCGYQFVGKRKPDVHHINADKKCNIDKNLICLCRSCHVTSENNIAVSLPILRKSLITAYGYQYGDQCQP
jgi:rubredoxin